MKGKGYQEMRLRSMSQQRQAVLLASIPCTEVVQTSGNAGHDQGAVVVRCPAAGEMLDIGQHLADQVVRALATLQGSIQALRAENAPSGIPRFGNAVGVEDEVVSRRQVDDRVGISFVGLQTQR